MPIKINLKKNIVKQSKIGFVNTHTHTQRISNTYLNDSENHSVGSDSLQP